MRQARLVADLQLTLGEGPRWSEREQVLYLVDIAKQALVRFDPITGQTRRRLFDSPVGCFAFRRGGGFVLAMADGFALIDSFEGPVMPFGAQVTEGRADIRFNDGRTDAAGRFFAGTVNTQKSASDAGIYRLTPEAAVTQLTTGALTCNGTAFSPDGRTLYHSDTPQHAIYTFDFEPTTGEISNKRVFHQFPFGEGRPDGASVDREGCYWTAMYDGGRVVRLSPAGEILETIALPVTRPTMIALGGPDLKTAYVTSARQNLDAEALALQPLAGGLFSFEVDVPGLSEPDFAG